MAVCNSSNNIIRPVFMGLHRLGVNLKAHMRARGRR